MNDPTQANHDLLFADSIDSGWISYDRGLTSPQEIPPFKLDEYEKPFAIDDDREDRSDTERATGKPIMIRESEPT